MNYEQKYKEALGWMQSLYDGLHGPTKEEAEHYFPELVEDEKIKNEIIAFLERKNVYMTPNEDLDFHNRWLAWLEKQGEHKPYGQRKECEYCQFNYAGECKGYCALKRNEQKPILDVKASDWYVSKVDGKIHNMYYSVDKVEPKFKVGDWVVNSTTLNLCHILKVEHGQYICDDCSFPITNENEYHLWTIREAKDGDVLVDSYSKDSITILYKGIYKERSILAHCGWNGYNFSVKTNGLGYGGLDNTNYLPATKEQRDLLFEKMKQEGYEWGQKEKKLIKMKETKFKVYDWVVRKDEEPFCNGNNYARITYIDREQYWFDSDSWLEAKDIRLWTINDAKDGDLIYVSTETKGIQAIFHKFENGIIYFHCNLCGDFAQGGYEPSGDVKSVNPLLKEQYQRFFQKMKQAGYEWDQKEKKLIKMKETKFKVGDWVVTDYGRVSRVVYVDKYGDGYTLDDGVYFSGSWCNMYHPWTIQDAKDGDVLVASDGSIFLFAGVVDCACKYYVALATDNHVEINKEAKGGYWETSRAVHPATKEQRVLLFEKMKEAGYEWDAEKKVLSKRDMGILPEAKMQAYIKYCNDKSPSNILCDKCNKAVTIEREYPYFYDKDENDVYFASICPECGELFITKE